MTLTLRLVPLETTARVRSHGDPRSWLGYLLTIGRLLFVPALVWSARPETMAVFFWLLFAFVLIDIFDGVVARRLQAETSLRRLLDGVVDKLSIHIVALFVCFSLPASIPFWVFMLARDVAQAAVGYAVLRKCRIVAAGAKWHRAFTISVAGWGLALVLFNSWSWAVGIVMVALGTITLIDYCLQCARLLQSRGHTRGFSENLRQSSIAGLIR